MLLLNVMAAQVGLDPEKRLFTGSRPNRQAARAVRRRQDRRLPRVSRRSPRNCAPVMIGHVIVNSTVDRPWSQYFCCMLAGNREFVRKHPVATKRVVRAILKATDLCANEPARVARQHRRSRLHRRATTMPPDAERDSLTTNGGNTTPRTRSGSTRCACTKSG